MVVVRHAWDGRDDKQSQVVHSLPCFLPPMWSGWDHMTSPGHWMENGIDVSFLG